MYVPSSTCAVEFFGKGVLALHYGVAYLYLVDGLVPRKVLTYGKADTCEGVAEVEVRCGVNTACSIVHVACAGRHEVLLVSDVGFYLEVYAGRNVGSSHVVDGHLRIVFLCWVDGKEAGIRLRERPTDRAVEFAVLLGLLCLEPFGSREYAGCTCAANTCRREVAKGGSLYNVGTGASIGLNRIYALDGGLDEAHVKTGIVVRLKAAAGKVGIGETCGNGSACHFESTAYGLFLYVVNAEAHQGVAVGAAAGVDIIVGARCCRQRNATHKE